MSDIGTLDSLKQQHAHEEYATNSPTVPSIIQATGCGCNKGAAENVPSTEQAASFVYALGRIEARFPSLSLEKEYAQVVARRSDGGQTDQRTFQSTLAAPENRYLARAVCWVMSVEGLPTYILRLRDPNDLEILINALRTPPRDTDVDVVIGLRGPLASPGTCNNLIVPVVSVDQIYSFNIDHLIEEIPKPKDAPKDFAEAAEELFHRIQQLADNAGALDEHRAINYLALRYPEIYSTTAIEFARNASLAAVDTRLSRLSGGRRIYDVIFTFAHRNTGVETKYFTRVDVTEQYPFLVSRLSPYYDR